MSSGTSKLRRAAQIGTGALVLVAIATAVIGGDVLIAIRRGPHPQLSAPVGGIDGCAGCGRLPGPMLRVLVLGDSTAAGVGVDSPAGTFIWLSAERLGHPIEVRSVAASGARTAALATDQLDAARHVVTGGFVPDVVVISVGANDATHLGSPDDVGRSHRAGVAGIKAVAPRARFVVLGVPDIGSAPRLPQPLRALAAVSGRRMDGAVRAAATDEAATYVDIAGLTGPAFRKDRGLFAADGYHPNARGYARWAEVVAPALGG